MRETGWTLLELLITSLLIAILAAIALPSFTDLLARQRQRAETDALFHAVHLAKKASITRNRVVSLCPSRDLASCDPGRDWSAGWLMFVNLDRDDPPTVDDGEAILRRHRVDERVIVRANRSGFSFRSTYRRATNGTLVVCDRSGQVAPRAVVVSYTGRPRLAFENTRGVAYDCAP